MSDFDHTVWIKPLASVLLFFAVIFGYLLPTLIATTRNHHNAMPIAIINIFMGWTVAGWFVAFIWSCTSPPPPSQIIISQEFADRYTRPEWEMDSGPRQPPIMLPKAQLPDHLFDKKLDD